ncbi:dihydrofolate reductase [Viridibacillus sp. YIM B01967]|uniref:Dihydrofolate reductase n=1 Tax=Viridibacillus soli TaxID=2798301 RepID=A0ABS1HA32_9BACL|nr:dihydrofolate reductase family protein [Viridibacillus soli]MBK3496282.1 dihydrofolate reductase [Viridibacillus soli]
MNIAKERKVILYIAMSLDGFIARTNGAIDWLDDAVEKGDGDNGYTAFYGTVDTVIIGRKTYDQVLTLADDFPYRDKECFVFSNTVQTDTSYVEFVNEDVGTFVGALKEREGGDIWLVGGAGLVDSFLKAGLIDEMIITVIPVLLGEGIPLFKEQANLQLIHSVRYGEFMQLYYRL